MRNVVCFTLCVPIVLSCAPSRPVASPKMGAEQLKTMLAEFRAANQPTMAEGVPGASVLTAAERAGWCTRMKNEARLSLPLGGDQILDAGPCALRLAAAPERQKLPGVSVRFDVEMFFRKPYAAATYDRATRTLFLPLAAMAQPWSEVPATQHEWMHAQIHARAMRGDAYAQALSSELVGPAYKPDSFHVDEVAVGICDLVQLAAHQTAPQPWQTRMAKRYAKMLSDEMPALRNGTLVQAPMRADVKGEMFGAGAVQYWLAGDQPLPHLEAIQRDAVTVLQLLEAKQPDLKALRAVPMVAAVCTTN